jgi:ABC-type multidrug transport system ATPase subunit
VATPGQIGENPLLAVARPKASRVQAQQSWKDAEAILARLGLAGREMSSADKVSLGQSKRVAIARAVQAGAKILFLDEPLAGLDSAGMKEVLSLLQELSSAKGITLVIVEHYFNIPEILKIATTVWTLDKGQVSRELPNQVGHTGSAIPGYTLDQWMRAIAGQDGEIHQTDQHGARISTIEPAGSKGSANVLAVHDLIVYRNKRLVVGAQNGSEEGIGVSLSLGKGQVVILQAPNGWGKTTLLEAIAGLVPTSEGTIMLEDQSVNSKAAWLRAKRGLRLLQSRNNFFPNLNVQESLSLAKLHRVPQDIQPLITKKMSYLSGGELQRVVTACALDGVKCSAILLDEPFTALDPTSVQELTNRINNVLQHAGVLIAVPSAHV